MQLPPTQASPSKDGEDSFVGDTIKRSFQHGRLDKSLFGTPSPAHSVPTSHVSDLLLRAKLAGRSFPEIFRPRVDHRQADHDENAAWHRSGAGRSMRLAPLLCHAWLPASVCGEHPSQYNAIFFPTAPPADFSARCFSSGYVGFAAFRTRNKCFFTCGDSVPWIHWRHEFMHYRRQQVVRG